VYDSLDKLSQSSRQNRTVEHLQHTNRHKTPINKPLAVSIEEAAKAGKF